MLPDGFPEYLTQPNEMLSFNQLLYKCQTALSASVFVLKQFLLAGALTGLLPITVRRTGLPASLCVQ